ncbi:MAG: peptidase, partial [Proteobacteria bacterium]|nr:peptidase [Pseudomonadota bacterium]
MHPQPEGRACRLWAAVALMALAGCASSGRKAPVEDRSTAAKPPVVATVTPPPVVGTVTPPPVEPAPKPLPGAENAGKPGYYTVKPGDTLLRIALDSGQNWRD